jgi:uncharacterized protein (TIGR02246 family)
MKLLSFLLLFTSITWAQLSPEPVVDIVQKQLIAYNAKNLSEFVALFHEDAELFNLGDSKPIASGKAQITEIYKRLFEQSPNLRSEVISRQVIGNKVLDYEVITGRLNQTAPVYLIAVYEIVDLKIKRCFFIRS